MKAIRVIATIALAHSLSGCWAGVYENPAAEYVRRTDTITTSAGNAPNVNAATHVIDPWPNGVANRRIPADGDRMTRAVERYKAGGGGGNQSQPGPQVIGIPVGAATPSISSGSAAPSQ